jgi:bis(5'-nucleosyl)-tetraphosphatase (symmetrical)
MSTYVIGDVHGCFKQFIGLLKKINYNKIKDRIILTGDLVNRGPESLAMLNFCMKDSNITTVLGNHDLYLMYLLSIHQGKGKLKKVVEAKNSKKIFKWLLSKPLMIEIYNECSDSTFFITHAGIPEIWSPKKAQGLANEVSVLLKKNPSQVLKSMWGDHPKKWSDHLSGDERQRIIINYLTRMRFLDKSSKLDLKNTSMKGSDGFRPWFNYVSKSHEKKKQYYIFGHWASLKGKTNDPYFIGLDTGCVWEGKLTAVRLEDLKKISI